MPPYPRTSNAARRARGEESRAALLQAGAELFGERGYAATPVGEICARAGVARTALYWHFGSKEGLLCAVVETVGLGWIETIQKAVYRETDPLARLQRLVEGWSAILEQQPARIRLPMIVALEQGESSERVREALCRVLERARRALVQGIEDSVGRTLPNLDPLAHTMLTLLQGTALRRLVDPERTDLASLFAEFRRTVWLAILDRLPPEEREAFETSEGCPPSAS